MRQEGFFRRVRSSSAAALRWLAGRLDGELDALRHGGPDHVQMPVLDRPKAIEFEQKSHNDSGSITTLDAVSSSDTLTNAEADEHVLYFLEWLLGSRIVGQIEGDRLRELHEQYAAQHCDRPISEPAFYRALRRAGVTRKDRRINKSDVRYAEFMRIGRSPKIHVYTLPDTIDPPEAVLREMVLSAQGLTEPLPLAA